MIWWQYLLLVNIYLLLFYGFYLLLLSRETFFQLNRLYLVAASSMSFFIPLIQSEWVKNLFITQRVTLTIYNANPVMLYHVKATEGTYITIGEILVVVYLIGILFLTGRFIFQLIILNKIIDNPEATSAYSFFKKIRIGKEVEDNPVIIAHENTHARQWHSVDIMMIEAVMIINWFNPIVYLYRSALKHIHEFIADRQVVTAGTDKVDYALLLLSQTFDAPVHKFVNPFFNNTLLKKRITMLQKNKSHRLSLVKYGLSVPLFILMLILSSATINNSKTIGFVNKKVEQVFLTPATVATPDDAEPAKIVNTAPATPSEITIDKPEGPIFTSVEKVPEFPGGLQLFGEFLGRNVHYPTAMRENNIQGRVLLSFVVEKNGALSDIKVVKDIAGGAGEEAMRVLKLSPKWDPGIQNGHPVRVAYCVPIAFTLSDDGPINAPENKTAATGENKDTVKFAAPANNTNDNIKMAIGKVIGSNSVIFTAPTSHPTPSKPIYIVDGKQVDNIGSLDANTIESINVLKNQAAISAYGANGANGVVIVSLKKNSQILPSAPVK